ncbi:hypothetical protein CEY12_04785 [Chryseobacterium sp. T16E-39]|uniref:hypothetical protein n=1 Tax=Chryseobacterium sp. T16E-39 TaxID=2015076 RepID=UPI000B5B23B0|nr:hypothetical protein [Chryseobacterium sp. T16E-39]ASK29459.1 hypothetical protein CEY12_04785 [Chryseobacterium sp. T16E-39]
MNQSKENEFVNDPEDLIWVNPDPISLNFDVASKKALAVPVKELTSGQQVMILRFTDIPFDAILPFGGAYKPDFKPQNGITLGKAYYFPYKTGPNASNFRGTVGNVDIPVSPSANDPHYVLTGEMNGCSLIVTKKTNETKCTVWHFPSPDSYKKEYDAFKKQFKNEIYGEIRYANYGGNVLKGEIDGVNYLYYNNASKKWQLSCIPISRVVTTDPQKLKLWNGNWVEKSSVPRFKKDIDFSKPIE